MKGTEVTEVTEVKDKTTDRWTTIIGLVALVTLPLVGVIGGRILNSMDKIVDTQLRTLESVSEINGHLKAYDSRISRTEKDVEEIHVIVDDHSQRIYKLEGLK